MTRGPHEPNSRARTGAWRIRLRRALVFIAIAWLVYLLLGNVFLNTALSDAAFNRHPERLAFEWRRALTLYPGQILAWDVTVKGHVRRVQWQADAPRARTRLALMPLLRRELRFPQIHAEDVDFAAGQVETDLAPRAPAPGGWTVRLDAIEATSLRRARWNDLALSGNGHARFGMIKQLRGGPLQILPSQLEMAQAELRRGGERVLADATLRARFEMDRHEGARHPGAARLAFIVAELSIEADAPGLDLGLGGDEQWKLALAPGAGRVQVDLGYERGLLREGGRVALQLPVSLEVDGGARRDNQLSIDAEVEAEGLRLRARLPQLPEGRARLDADLHIAQRRLPLQGVDALLPLTSGEVDLNWRFDSLRWLSDALVHEAWLRFDGDGELDASLRIEGGQLAAGSRFDVPAVEIAAHVLRDRITGRAHAQGRIAADPRSGVPQARVELVLDEYAMAPEESPAAPYVTGRDLNLVLESSGELARFRDTLQAQLRFRGARVPDLRRYNDYLPGANLQFTGGSGTLGGELSLDARGRVARGRFDVRATGAALRFATRELRGDVAIDTRLARADLAQREFELDGTRIALERVAFRDAVGNERRDWWARIVLPRAHAEWGRPLSLDGEATIEMKDVGFVLALFGQKKFPRWVMRLVDAGRAEVRGIARVRGKTLVLDRLRAENRRFELRARLKLEDARAQGDLLLRWGVLALGVELAPGDRDYHLIRATDWYESRPDLL
jgi:hypothetical protein